MTRREREILAWFHDRIQEDGVAPTYREAAAVFNCSFSSVYRVVRQLMESGHIVRQGARNGRRSAFHARLPGTGLLAAEVAWCHANPERVRAMISVTGGCRMESLH